VTDIVKFMLKSKVIKFMKKIKKHEEEYYSMICESDFNYLDELTRAETASNPQFSRVFNLSRRGRGAPLSAYSPA
jgi:hypothetical protein